MQTPLSRIATKLSRNVVSNFVRNHSHGGVPGEVSSKFKILHNGLVLLLKKIYFMINSANKVLALGYFTLTIYPKPYLVPFYWKLKYM